MCSRSLEAHRLGARVAPRERGEGYVKARDRRHLLSVKPPQIDTTPVSAGILSDWSAYLAPCAAIETSSQASQVLMRCS
jgi:hypothetical protein